MKIEHSIAIDIAGHEHDYDVEFDTDDMSDSEIFELIEERKLEVIDLDAVIRFIEARLWSPSDWAFLQDALAVAVKPRGVA